MKVKDQRIPRAGSELGEDSGLRRKAIILASILAFVALVVGSLFGDRGILQLLEVREQASALERQIGGLKAENARLVEEILELRTSPQPIERLAREQLGLSGRDEMVFVIRPNQPPQP